MRRGFVTMCVVWVAVSMAAGESLYTAIGRDGRVVSGGRLEVRREVDRLLRLDQVELFSGGNPPILVRSNSVRPVLKPPYIRLINGDVLTGTVVRYNRGGPGIDGETIEKFEQNLSKNLYKLWNRMASGSYMPKGVKRVDIPKPDGRTRPLGIPSVSDRIAQTVVKRRLEPELERVFSDSSYGFRPRRSAKQAVKKARENCWKKAWVVDIDIQSFFDEIDHDLLIKAVGYHTTRGRLQAEGLKICIQTVEQSHD